MNVHLPVHMAKPEFLAWVDGREGHYELDDGRVVMMVGASRAHALIVRNLLALIQGQVDQQKWDVIADFGLDTGPKSLRYPDIVVDRAGGALSDYTATAPAFLVEVLSPTTESVDMGDKAAEYLRIADLEAYLIVAQDRCKAWLWARENEAFPAAPVIFAGLDKIIRLKSLDLELPLAAVYIGLDVGR